VRIGWRNEVEQQCQRHTLFEHAHGDPALASGTDASFLHTYEVGMAKGGVDAPSGGCPTRPSGREVR